ncbi:hypothetical protein EZ428_03400 [Pedobacter frigiditerrae]|uniref:Uncharacterized protein n=1 Tax=Pedobacter frigiditerrae TaxID=2530452 RepID=A0A4R0N1Y0_9SPHI|nr:hypothetical protein [Pedobacter frigiditerrae]TCC93829.1 hypothetical protein EZ428_03400 [Pedobacter frigiditerrae]
MRTIIKAAQFPIKMLIDSSPILSDSAPSPNANQYIRGMAKNHTKPHIIKATVKTIRKCNGAILDFNISFILLIHKEIASVITDEESENEPRNDKTSWFYFSKIIST